MQKKQTNKKTNGRENTFTQQSIRVYTVIGISHQKATFSCNVFQGFFSSL